MKILHALGDRQEDSGAFDPARCSPVQDAISLLINWLLIKGCLAMGFVFNQTHECHYGRGPRPYRIPPGSREDPSRPAYKDS